jgi:hypothetical protein
MTEEQEAIIRSHEEAIRPWIHNGLSSPPSNSFYRTLAELLVKSGVIEFLDTGEWPDAAPQDIPAPTYLVIVFSALAAEPWIEIKRIETAKGLAEAQALVRRYKEPGSPWASQGPACWAAIQTICLEPLGVVDVMEFT